MIGPAAALARQGSKVKDAGGGGGGAGGREGAVESGVEGSNRAADTAAAAQPVGGA